MTGYVATDLYLATLRCMGSVVCTLPHRKVLMAQVQCVAAFPGEPHANDEAKPKPDYRNRVMSETRVRLGGFVAATQTRDA